MALGEHWRGSGSESEGKAERVRESKGCASQALTLPEAQGIGRLQNLGSMKKHPLDDPLVRPPRKTRR